MARCQPYDVDQDKFIPVSFRDQTLPGSFEHTLSESEGIREESCRPVTFYMQRPDSAINCAPGTDQVGLGE